MGNRHDGLRGFGNSHLDGLNCIDHSGLAPEDGEAARTVVDFALEGMLADLGLGVALLDGTLRPLRFSRGYGDTLARCGLSSQAPASFGAAAAITRRLFTADFHERLRCGRAETVVLSESRPVGVFRRIERHHAQGNGRDVAGMLILRGCAAAAGNADSRTTLLRDAYRMTEREASIALKIASGRAVDATAAELGISINTMRTHLKRIYDKTQVAGQTELVNRILASPIGWLASQADTASPRAGERQPTSMQATWAAA